MVRGARRQLAHRADAAQQLFQRIENGCQFGMKLSVQPSAEQLAGGVVMALAQLEAKFKRLLEIAPTCGICHGEKLVGDLGHGADDHERAFACAFFDDGGDAVDGRRVLHRGAAKLHDDHGSTAAGSSITTDSLAL